MNVTANRKYTTTPVITGHHNVITLYQIKNLNSLGFFLSIEDDEIKKRHLKNG